MILINLMPHREWARRRRLERGLMVLVLAALLGHLMSWMAAEVLQQAAHARGLKHESRVEQAGLHARLARQVAQLKVEADELGQREQALQELIDRSSWRAQLAANVATSLPPTVRLSALRLDDAALHLAGHADNLPALNDWLKQGLVDEGVQAGQREPWRLGAAQWLELRSQREGSMAEPSTAQTFSFSLKLPLIALR